MNLDDLTCSESDFILSQNTIDKIESDIMKSKHAKENSIEMEIKDYVCLSQHSIDIIEQDIQKSQLRKNDHTSRTLTNVSSLYSPIVSSTNVTNFEEEDSSLDTYYLNNHHLRQDIQKALYDMCFLFKEASNALGRFRRNAYNKDIEMSNVFQWPVQVWPLNIQRLVLKNHLDRKQRWWFISFLLHNGCSCLVVFDWVFLKRGNELDKAAVRQIRELTSDDPRKNYRKWNVTYWDMTCGLYKQYHGASQQEYIVYKNSNQ